MKKKNIIKNTLAGIVLALSTTIGGACREPIPEQNPEPFKIQQCSVEADFGQFQVGSTRKLMEEESIQSWNDKKMLLLHNDGTPDDDISTLSPTEFYLYDREIGDTLETIITHPTNPSWMTMVFNRGSSEVVVRAPKYYSKEDTIPELDAVYPTITHPVTFDALYEATFKDLKLIVSGRINNSDIILFLLDMMQPSITSPQSSRVSKSTTKTMLTPQIAGIQSEYIDHNSTFILYKMKKTPNANPQPNIQEGVYAYDTTNNTSTFISVEGKEDKVVSLLEDRALLQKQNGEIWQVSLKDFTKRKETEAGKLFLTTIKGLFMAYDTINIKGDNTYILYRDSDPLTLQNKDDILLKNIDIPASYTSWNTGVSMHSPKVFPLPEARKNMGLAYVLLKQNTLSQLIEFTGPQIKKYDMTGAPEGNDATIQFLGSPPAVRIPQGSNPWWEFYIFQDSNKKTILTFRGDKDHTGSFGPYEYPQPFFVLPEFTIVSSSLIPYVTTGGFDRRYPGTAAFGRGSKKETMFDTIRRESQMAIRESFFDENAVRVLRRTPEGDQQLYFDMEKGEIFRIDGEYASDIYGISGNFYGTVQETYEYEATLKTHPPRFLLHDHLGLHKIIVKPE